MVSEAKKRSNYKYTLSHYKRVPLDVQKVYYAEVLKPAADAAGEPVATFIKKAIQMRIEGERCTATD